MEELNERLLFTPEYAAAFIESLDELEGTYSFKVTQFVLDLVVPRELYYVKPLLDADTLSPILVTWQHLDRQNLGERDKFVAAFKEQTYEYFGYEIKEMYAHITTEAYDWGDTVSTDHRYYASPYSQDVSWSSTKQFVCSMRYGGCEERGYCNGDC